MKYAIIETGGKQYKIEDGQYLDIEKIKDYKEGDQIIFDKVLLLVNQDKIELGNPYLKDKKIDGQVLKAFKDKKISIIKFKSKSNYKKSKGHRQNKLKVKFSIK